MDQAIANWPVFIEIVKAAGPTGLVLILWYFSRRDQERMFETYRKDMQAMLAEYQSDTDDQRNMYKNNVKLVEQVIAIAESQQNIIIMNTQIQQKLVDKIDSNQFCPLIKMKKLPKIEGVQG
jgi:hypothetical protein